MNDHFQDLFEKHDLLKVRFLFLSSAICSPIFYYLMILIGDKSIDNLTFRYFNSLICFIGFFSTFYQFKYQKQTIWFFHMLGRACWLGLYLFLLHVNNWSLYERWSYFGLVFVLCGSAFSWKDYLFMTTVCISSSVILSFFSTGISVVEIIHFHLCTLAPIITIGFSIKAHFHFKKEVRLLTHGLIEKSQISVLAEVAAGVSHEVNSPLMVFSYSLHQLQRQLSQPEPDKVKINALTEKMKRMIDRISTIVNALKVYSVESIDDKLEPVNLLTLIDESLSLCNRKFIENGIVVKKETNSTELNCLAKKSQVIQCFLNLINNAIEACQEMPSPQILINTSIKETYACISITDNGRGIAEEFTSKIMNPFFTTKEIGTGLGLSVSQGIARAHQGELFLDRNLEHTTFVLKIPLEQNYTK